MTKITIDRSVVEQALEALRCVDLQSLVPDYGSGHYSVARLDGPQVKSAITAMEAALAEEQAEPDSPERRCGGPGCDMKCCQPVQEPVAWSHINGTSDTKWQPQRHTAGATYSDMVSDGGMDPRNRLSAENERIGPLAERVLELKAQRDALLLALRWIATVNAMDYEYQKVARDAISAVEE